MLNNENMYKTVYFLRFKDNAVMAGRLIGTDISDNGYIKHTVQMKDQFFDPDDAIVFYTREEAEKALKAYKPINDKIISVMNTANLEIDALRETINGKPHFPEYAKIRKAK
nr:MAG TPA: hypothetical protein [Caudoviricetes sp.]